jgi:nitroreductase
MIELSREDARGLVEEARLAPSVHNVQPARWRISGARVELLGDPARAIPVADPHWRDWWLSHGAALEGFDIALGRRGLAMRELSLEPAAALAGRGALVPVARFVVAPGEGVRQAPPVEGRATWRGTFAPVDASVSAALGRFTAAREDVTLILPRGAIADVATLAERASLYFLRDSRYRRELLQWMRLSRRHPAYQRDGLNAQALQLSTAEAVAAGMVLGPLFVPLDTIGLAATLLSEAGKSRSASALVLLHRPVGEHPAQSGRAFYRAWLDLEEQGLKACPVSVLVDWPESCGHLARTWGVPAGRQLISVLRTGRPSRAAAAQHARLPVDELLVVPA